LTIELPPGNAKTERVAQKLFEIVEREIANRRKSISPENLMIQAIREAGLG